MTIGTFVAYVKDPNSYGVMRVRDVTPKGWLICESRDEARWEFRPEEVDTADKLYSPEVIARAEEQFAELDSAPAQ